MSSGRKCKITQPRQPFTAFLQLPTCDTATGEAGQDILALGAAGRGQVDDLPTHGKGERLRLLRGGRNHVVRQSLYRPRSGKSQHGNDAAEASQGCITQES